MNSNMFGCFCCSCKDELDPACRNHGAHGMRECTEHKSAPEACKWEDGCGMTMDKVLEGKH